MPKITPFLWYDTQAKEAAEYYVSLFPNSKILYSNPMSTNFILSGQELIALNGGPQYTFNEAISLFVSCSDQTEVDLYWNRFVDDGGAEGQCGWLKDKYGLSWQIIPKQLWGLIGDPDPAKAKRATEAMLAMKKIVIAEIERAHSGS